MPVVCTLDTHSYHSKRIMRLSHVCGYIKNLPPLEGALSLPTGTSQKTFLTSWPSHARFYFIFLFKIQLLAMRHYLHLSKLISGSFHHTWWDIMLTVSPTESSCKSWTQHTCSYVYSIMHTKDNTWQHLLTITRSQDDTHVLSTSNRDKVSSSSASSH